MVTLRTIMVWMIFTLVSTLPRLRLFLKNSSSLAHFQTMTYFWKTVFIHWSREERGDVIMGTSTRMMCSGRTRELTEQSPKLNAVTPRSQTMW